jgi:hypothetical protein
MMNDRNDCCDHTEGSDQDADLHKKAPATFPGLPGGWTVESNAQVELKHGEYLQIKFAKH